MNILPVDEGSLQKAVDILRRGGVVAHATETCYGLACDLSNSTAVEKLFAIKERPREQSVSGLFASIEDAKQYVEWNAAADDLATKHLPGPLTLVLALRKDASKTLYPIPAGGETIGVRISSHEVAQKLVEMCGSPLSTTSANVHGKANPYSAEDLKNQYAEKSLVPDLVLDSGAIPQNDASTVVDVSKGVCTVLRQGSLAL